jgi:hypothetical protein
MKLTSSHTYDMHLSRERTICILSVFKRIREEQYVVLESLYLQMALVDIFAYIYRYSFIYIDIYMHIDG